MNRRAKEETPYYFAPGKSLFQIVVEIKSDPASLGAVLGALGGRVKLVGTASYVSPDGATILSAFAEGISKDESASKLRRLVSSTPGVAEVEVTEGKDGLLVDTFHTGLETGGESLMIMRRRALARMLDRVYELLGTGGEVLLYQQGIAVGRANGEGFVGSLGAGKVKDNLDYLSSNLAALGWGRISPRMGTGDVAPRILVQDCFECSSNDGARTGCHFFRGYILGNVSAIFGQEFVVEEVKCIIKGAQACEFVATPKTGPGIGGAGITI